MLQSHHTLQSLKRKRLRVSRGVNNAVAGIKCVRVCVCATEETKHASYVQQTVTATRLLPQMAQCASRRQSWRAAAAGDRGGRKQKFSQGGRVSRWKCAIDSPPAVAT